MKFLLIGFLLMSCANVKPLSSQTKEDMKPDLETEKKKREIPVQELEVFNGRVKFIKFPIPENTSDKPTLVCKEIGREKPLIQNLPVMIEGDHGLVYYAESYFSEAKEHYCEFDNYPIAKIKVKNFPYKEEFLKVDKKRVTLNKKDQERANREWEMTQKIYKNSDKNLLIDGSFMVPLKSYITSHYGNRRVFNNKKKTQHLGNDFRARVGVPIPVSNRGRIVFVGDLFYTGNVVIVDHGLNIFTLYAHLSKIKAEVGDIVKKGQIIGLSGRTGRVSGPHLHWGVKMNGHNINGFSLVDESKAHYSK